MGKFRLSYAYLNRSMRRWLELDGKTGISKFLNPGSPWMTQRMVLLFGTKLDHCLEQN